MEAYQRTDHAISDFCGLIRESSIGVILTSVIFDSFVGQTAPTISTNLGRVLIKSLADRCPLVPQKRPESGHARRSEKGQLRRFNNVRVMSV